MDRTTRAWMVQSPWATFPDLIATTRSMAIRKFITMCEGSSVSDDVYHDELPDFALMLLDIADDAMRKHGNDEMSDAICEVINKMNKSQED